ncbi:MAG: glycosyltransferase family 4 protein, partial [Candidatus Nanohaloarchaea archaeon]
AAELSDSHDFTIYGRERTGLELWLKHRKGGTIPYELFDNFRNRVRLHRILPDTDVVIVNRDFCGRFDDNLTDIVAASDSGFVYDVDDLMWGDGKRDDHYMRYLRKADIVTVSSDYIQEKAGDVADEAVKIPTACDTEKFQFSPASNEKPTMLWMDRWLKIPEVAYDVRDAVEALQDEFDFTLKLVGVNRQGIRDIFEPLDSTEVRGFIPHEEIPSLLQDVDIGLYPLDRGEFQRGKSPTALFEYMAAGAVPVATSIGEIETVISHGQDGFLAEEEGGWEAAIRTALQSDLTKISRSARTTVEEGYSLNIAAERYGTVINKVAERYQ